VIANSDRFLLAILNSKLMNFYLKSVCPFVRGEYYEYMPQYVERFPVAKNRKFAKEIADNVEKTINASKEIFETKRKVYARITDNLQAKITTKLSDFQRISFGEFLKEINKQKKHLSLEEQDNWAEYLKLHSETINRLIEEVQKSDEVIDRLVFESYELNDKEIQLIEDDLRGSMKD
jgi:Ni,Fe-hydrogenase I large subunit